MSHCENAPCWAKSGGAGLHYRLPPLLFRIDCNSSSTDQLLSDQHCTNSCDTCQVQRNKKIKKNKCAKQVRDKISRDKADQCKAGGQLPAAECELIIVLLGPRLINLTDVSATARVINSAHAIFSLCKLYLQPCCHFLLDKTHARGERGAKSIPAAACVCKQVLITPTCVHVWFSALLSVSCSCKVLIFTCYYFLISKLNFDGRNKWDHTLLLYMHSRL